MKRLLAEWEPQSAVLIAWPNAETDWSVNLSDAIACYTQIAKAILNRQPLIVLAHQPEKVHQQLQHSNLRVVQYHFDDTWLRDYGPIAVEENRQLQLLDFQFNGWGLKFACRADNEATYFLHQQKVLNPQLPLLSTGFVLEGGAIETDGAGTLLTTSNCLCSYHRNPHLSQQQIELELLHYLGIKRVLWLDHGHLAGDDTDAHIDTLARFCSSDTIAYVQCTDQKDEHYKALQQMEQQLQHFTQADGSPYQLVPLPMPAAIYATDGHRLPATYANFLIINGAVLAPTYGVAEDNLALKQLQKCFPQHELVSINCRALIEQHGSLHCMSMQLAKGVVKD